MFMDIMICVIVLATAICYAKRGFAKSVLSALSWLICMACGLFFCDDIKAVLEDTGIARDISKNIESGIAGSIEDSEAMRGIPSAFGEFTGKAADYVAKESTDLIMSVVLALISFFAIIITLKIIFFIFIHLFSKDYHEGLFASVDTTGGFILGLVLGILFALIFLAAMVLVVKTSPDGAGEAVLGSLEESFFAGYIYDHNPLLGFL